MMGKARTSRTEAMANRTVDPAKQALAGLLADLDAAQIKYVETDPSACRRVWLRQLSAVIDYLYAVAPDEERVRALFHLTRELINVNDGAGSEFFEGTRPHSRPPEKTAEMARKMTALAVVDYLTADLKVSPGEAIDLVSTALGSMSAKTLKNWRKKMNSEQGKLPLHAKAQAFRQSVLRGIQGRCEQLDAPDRKSGALEALHPHRA